MKVATNVEVCGRRALMCGPCQLQPGHEQTRCLCSHYARNGVEIHDRGDPRCECGVCRWTRAGGDGRTSNDPDGGLPDDVFALCPDDPESVTIGPVDFGKNDRRG